MWGRGSTMWDSSPKAKARKERPTWQQLSAANNYWTPNSQYNFLVSHHGDYIRKDRPNLLKSNTEHGFLLMQNGPSIFRAYRETCWALYIEIFICNLPVGRGRDNQWSYHEGKQQQISTGRWKQHLARCSFFQLTLNFIQSYLYTQVIYSYCCEILLYCNLFISSNMSSSSSHIKFVSRILTAGDVFSWL